MEFLAFDEIQEENIVIEGDNRRLCDMCILEIHEIYRSSFYLCFTCNKYFCVECFRNHDINHNFLTRESKQNEIDSALYEACNESNIFETEKVSMHDRVPVKHVLDKWYCYISGLCGLNNNKWVACDHSNSSIKIFQSGSNVLLRYLRIGSKPYDVTEIQVKETSTVPDSASSSSSDISGRSSTQLHKRCLLAATLPIESHILFIDIYRNPAVRVRTVTMDNKCWRIEYNGDNIFALCNEGPIRTPCSVYVMSTDGDKLSVIQTGIPGLSSPDLAVLPGRVYLTDWYNNKVKCLNLEGRILSEITLEGLEPHGISLDFNNNVYIGSMSSPNNVYKLNLDLVGPAQPLLDPNTVYMESNRDLSFYRDTLFVSHFGINTVSVISLVKP